MDRLHLSHNRCRKKSEVDNAIVTLVKGLIRAGLVVASSLRVGWKCSLHRQQLTEGAGRL